MDNSTKIDNQTIYKWIDLIEKDIERMATNSAHVKTWTISLFAAIIALTQKTSLFNPLIVFAILMVLIIMMYLLDVFYLKKEKEFIELYNKVIKLLNGSNDVDLLDNILSLSINKFKIDSSKARKEALTSGSVLFVYLPLEILCVVLICFIILG